MIERIIEWCAGHRWTVMGILMILVGFAIDAVRKTPLDALPDLSDPQVIVFTDWMGRSPDLVEDQVTYPLVRALQSTPNVRAVRGYSMFGMSFIYAIFQDGTDIYWARTRVLEQLGRAQQLLPPNVAPQLGPDATGIGWVFQYVLQDSSGRMDLAKLRELQDFTVRPVLQAVTGVAEVASLGGFERQFQIVLDPARLAAYGLTLGDVTRSVRDANAEVGARVIEMAGREYIIRGRGYVKSLTDLEQSLVTMGAGGTPVRLRDIATVQFGPEIRRGAADLNGQGEAVGGIVVMRIGSNALDVTEAIKQQISTLTLPPNVSLVPTYDRSSLIKGSISTLKGTLMQEGIIVALICIVFLMHVRSALVAIIILPLSVLLSFIAMRYMGLSANIMSLGGIAIAVGELSDAAIVLIENAHVRLANAPAGADRERIIIDACKEVGRPIFFSLLLITVSFLPIFTLTGQAGRLFAPLAYTKTFAMFTAAILSITVAPPLMLWLLRGHFRTEAENPVNRVLSRLYFPIARQVIRWRVAVVVLALIGMVGTIPVLMRLGSEFMPPLDEGSLLVMPSTFPGISIEEARQALTAQDRIIKSFPEVASVHGKAGRAETATDPAQLDMNEIVVQLKPKEDWPLHTVQRWYSQQAADWIKPALRAIWPEKRVFTLDELSREMANALQMPGYQMAIAPPIRTRIDMLTTGVRTPVGIKVFGDNLATIERISIQLEGMLRQVSGTRSTFAERQTGREYIDVVPDREAIARYGLSMRDVQDVVESAIGGMPVSTVINGRARFSVNLRYAADYRADPEALRAILVPVTVSDPVAGLDRGNSGGGASGTATGASGSGGGMGGMGGSDSRQSGGASTQAQAMPTQNNDSDSAWRQPGATVPLGALAKISIVTGPPMIKDENGVLVGFVFADIDSTKTDLGSWVKAAKSQVSSSLQLPTGYRLQWTGQYEFMAEMEAKLRIMLPITLILIIALLYLAMKGIGQTMLVLLSLPFAVAGSIWFLAFMGYNLSTAVWVGLIAVAGVSAGTGIVMVVYLDETFERFVSEGRMNTADDVDAAVLEGASARVRPLVMTVATTVFGLMPLLWDDGVGADISARTAAPVVGGLFSCMILTLLVLPAAYTLWRRYQLRHNVVNRHE